MWLSGSGLQRQALPPFKNQRYPLPPHSWTSHSTGDCSLEKKKETMSMSSSSSPQTHMWVIWVDFPLDVAKKTQAVMHRDTTFLSLVAQPSFPGPLPPGHKWLATFQTHWTVSHPWALLLVLCVHLANSLSIQSGLTHDIIHNHPGSVSPSSLSATLPWSCPSIMTSTIPLEIHMYRGRGE